jgi:hypothetical protein
MFACQDDSGSKWSQIYQESNIKLAARQILQGRSSELSKSGLEADDEAVDLHECLFLGCSRRRSLLPYPQDAVAKLMNGGICRDPGAHPLCRTLQMVWYCTSYLAWNMKS